MPEPSPAQRYAAFRARQAAPVVELFAESLDFDLDDFQRQACRRLEAGHGVLVTAPTGAGKTVVARFAAFLALREANAKVFYTTPMKALSNQKYREFCAEYGTDTVGLLTGDTNINSRARIVVMTTEVLRNMIYAGSELLTDLAYVIMDEVHYLADRFRGAVWEEVILHLPEAVQLVSLSATVSNAREFGDWLQLVRGDTDVIVSEERPVPLHQHVLAGRRFVDVFASPGSTAVNPQLRSLERGGHPSGPRRGRGRGRPRPYRPALRVDRAAVGEALRQRELLPVIVFIFSRNGCDDAVTQVLRRGIRLTTPDEREQIRAIVDERCAGIAQSDLAVLGYWEWLEGLERGVAAHHAGLLPAFKEVVEALFQRKLVKVVYATETLALGINMPARTVVIERLEKFNGEARVPISSSDYAQLTGRAGRRGIDVEGHAVIVWTGASDADEIAGLAARRSFPLNSSFRPGYNMAVNLIERFGRDETRRILELSFAQFQADRAVVDLARKARGQEDSLAGYTEAMACDRGDFAEYARLRRELSDLERLRVPSHDPEAKQARARELGVLRARLRAHPCHQCPDREKHARWGERWWALKRRHDKLQRQIRRRTGAVAAVFDRVGDVLLACGYLTEADGVIELTDDGRRLQRIYGERDLLVAESLRTRSWAELDAAGLAAVAAAVVYEPRRDGDSMAEARVPARVRTALDRLNATWGSLDRLERDHGMDGSEPPAEGLSPAMMAWASGAGLERVLDQAELAAGDFVRWAKQVIDLLDQVSLVADPPVATTARRALDAMRRGIVADSMLA